MPTKETTSTLADRILGDLNAVASARATRALDEQLTARVLAVKAYQQQRFRHTYADLLADARYAPAARFFLDELYGPRDFSSRDAQFARVVPALVRLFPKEMIQTVAALSSLHALSESLDGDMACHLASSSLTRADYVAAWQSTKRADDRRLQIALTIDVGKSLDRYTRRPLLRQSLRMMRSPARAAGLSVLQRFLETGFETFAAMRGADEFLATICAREQALATALVVGAPAAAEQLAQALP